MTIIDTPHKRKYGRASIIPALNLRQERQTILKHSKNGVIVGSYAFNKQMKYPAYQKRPFTDIDIKHSKPKRTAIKIETALDQNVGFNNYYVSQLDHDAGTTFRVHSRARGDTVVSDVGKLDKPIPSVSLNSNKYETLAHRKKAIQKMLDDPEAEYRREKDRIMMGYIKRAEKLEEMKRQMRW